MTTQEIMSLLSEIQDPRTKKSLSESVSIKEINEDGSFLKIRLHIHELKTEEKVSFRKMIEEHLDSKGIEAMISIVSETPQKPVQPQPQAPKGIVHQDILDRFKKRIAVYSTKGGVGKSTTSVALALELAKKGYKIALVDLDIYGPSVPRIIGLQDPITTSNDKFVPAERDGIHMMSVGLLIDSVDSPLIWRAPIVTGVIGQLFNDTLWDKEYDFLIIDMPPGTGDIPITVGQSLQLDGILGITTPQGVALEDTLKGLSMFKKYNVPLLGMIYNMGSVICPDCNKMIPLYPKNHDYDELLMNYQLEIVANLPMDATVIQAADEGNWDLVEEHSFWKKEFAQAVLAVEKIQKN